MFRYQFLHQLIVFLHDPVLETLSVYCHELRETSLIAAKKSPTRMYIKYIRAGVIIFLLEKEIS